MAPGSPWRAYPEERGDREGRVDVETMSPIPAQICMDLMNRINLHFYPSDFRHESRMLRVGHTLVKHDLFDEIVYIAKATPDLPSQERVGNRQRVLRLGNATASKAAGLFTWMRAAYAYGVRQNVACINCHSLTALPLCVALKHRTGASLIYDTHELETQTASASPLRRRIATLVERVLMGAVDLTIVVCDSIRRWYTQTYATDQVFTIKNYPGKWQSASSGQDLRRELGLAGEDEVFLYQGKIGVGRGVELLLEVFQDPGLHEAWPRRHLVFMGDGPLREHVQEVCAAHDHVHWIAPVPPNQVLSMTRQADAAFCLFEPISKSYELSLPNKLLEALACEVPVIASDLPEIRSEMQNGRYGWLVAPEVDALRAAIHAATPAALASRRVALKGWAETHNWESQEERLVHLYNTLLKTSKIRTT